MARIKVFDGAGVRLSEVTAKVEAEVNAWLAANEATITNVQMIANLAQSYDPTDRFTVFSYTVTVAYEQMVPIAQWGQTRAAAVVTN